MHAVLQRVRKTSSKHSALRRAISKANKSYDFNTDVGMQSIGGDLAGVESVSFITYLTDGGSSVVMVAQLYA